MAYDDKKPIIQKAHNLILENRKRMSVTGVERVDSFDEGEISMFTTGGILYVRGTDLHMDKLDLDAGDLIITGLVTDISYEEVAKTSSLWSKLFNR